MASLPYIQLYTADYLADTAHLSTVEHGAYLLLIFNYWQRGESFKAKDEQTLNKRLASVARLSNDEWSEIKETLSEFFTVTDTEWSHDRIDRDLLSVNSKSEKARAAGKASAAKRTNKRSTFVEQTFNHTDTDTDTDTELEKDKSFSSAEPKGSTQQPEQKIVFSLPTNKKDEVYPVLENDFSVYVDLYPAVDTMQAFRNMLGWLNAKPERRKTARGMKSFITNWLAKEQNSGGTMRSNVASIHPAHGKSSPAHGNAIREVWQ